MCSSTNYLWKCAIMYYLWLTWLLWQPWQPCIWLMLWTNCKKVRKKYTHPPISTILLYHRDKCGIMCLSTTPFSKTVILPNIQWMWLPWHPYRFMLWGNEETSISLSPFYNIDLRESNLVCRCKSIPLLFTTGIMPSIELIWLPWQLLLLHWHCITLKYYLNRKKYWVRSYKKNYYWILL